MGNMRPLRGDTVSYHGKHFFFQPLGNACALYDSQDDIGYIDKAKHKPQVHSVFLVKQKERVTEDDDKAIKEGRGVTESLDEGEEATTEQEQMWVIIDTLLAKVARLELKVSKDCKWILYQTYQPA